MWIAFATFDPWSLAAIVGIEGRGAIGLNNQYSFDRPLTK
jgi:hypothetical protein